MRVDDDVNNIDAERRSEEAGYGKRKPNGQDHSPPGLEERLRSGEPSPDSDANHDETGDWKIRKSPVSEDTIRKRTAETLRRDDSDEHVVPFRAGRSGGSGIGGGSDEWRINIPDIPKEAIQDLAAGEDAKAQVRSLVESEFDAQNSTDGISELIEADYASSAADFDTQAGKVKAEANRWPQMQHTVTREPSDPAVSNLNRRMAQIALAMAIPMLIAATVFVALGIERSGQIGPIVDNWVWGLPFGLPVVAALFASKIIRTRLTEPGGRRSFDIAVGIANIVALTVWIAIFAPTFLSSTGDSGSGGFSALGSASLVQYYTAHLFLELAAGLGLMSLIDLGFTDGRRVNHAVHPVQSVAASLVDDLRKQARVNHDHANRCRGRRAQLDAARERFVRACLGYLARCQATRAQKHAQAEAVYYENKIA